jgi:hypothetical protein
MNKMMNFYKNEYPSGYLQLRLGQEYLLVNNAEWKKYVRFTPLPGGEPLYMSLNYLPAEKTISYSFPESLNANTNYKIEFVSIPVGSSEEIDKNIQNVTTNSENEAGEMQVTEKKATGELTIPGEKIIYENYFRTSLYNTFIEKVEAISLPQGYTWPVAQGIYEVGGNFTAAEPFDQYELNEDEETSLVQFTADENCQWLRNYAIPIIYSDYPINGNITIKWRNTQEDGVVPLKAIALRTTGTYKNSMTMEDFISGVSGASGYQGVLVYKLNITAVYDWDDILTGAFKATVNTPRITKILNSPCPAILFNTTYPVRLTYKLPGLNKVTNSAIIKIPVI